MNELENYIANHFVKQEGQDYSEEFIAQWQEWLMSCNIPEILNDKICFKRPVEFREPDKITIEIYESAAGKIPVITFDRAADFEDFIVNATCKGIRPDNISQMGASFVYGRTQRFLMLSKKYYSNVSPEFVKLSPEEWREKSMILRREHECTHYYTKRFYGSASNNLHDELIADFFGIYAAFGHYEARLFKHFMGHGRLSLYTQGLSQGTRDIIAELAIHCADTLEAWSKSESFTALDKASRINYLCETDIRELAKT
ncbi:MAG: hypothetical protein IJT58_06210 [Synergistaceae bacterium]|nr:hypothetical protein [Synergistaceae bacterium]